MKTSFDYRATWVSGFLWGIGVWLSLLLALLAFTHYLGQGKGMGDAVASAILGFLVGCAFAFVGSIIGGLPIQLVLEPIMRLWAWRKELEDSAQDIHAVKK